MARAKKGITEAEIKLEWNDAARLGTRVHANMEHMMNGKPPPIKPDTMRERQIMAAGWDAMQAIKNAEWIPLAAEKMVLGLAWKLAGTIDAIFRRGNEVMLVDWKTNKAIRKSGFNGAKMLKPVQWLDDCEFIKYSLQLNLYERILIMEGYLPSVSETRKQLVHLTPDGFKVIQVKKCMRLKLSCLIIWSTTGFRNNHLFENMKYLSVCSGIEAASVAWKDLGWEAVGFSEIEPFPCAVLEHRFPDVKNYGDMTKYKV